MARGLTSIPVNIVDDGLHANIDRSPLDEFIEDALHHEELTDHNPKKQMSASMFPMCSILLFTQLWHQRTSGRFWRKSNVLLDIFAGSGTAMHEKLQYALGFSGKQFGHYHCKNYRCKDYLKTDGFRPKIDNPKLHTFTTDNICPTCGRGMAYVEIAIERDDIIMYLDSVIVVGKGKKARAIVLDLKSCTSNAAFKARTPADLAKHNNIAQIRAYAVEFEREYDVRVEGYGLAYIPRDNPRGFKVHYVPFDDAEASRAFKAYKRERKKWHLTNEVVESQEIEALEKGRLCSSSNEHDKLHPFEPCPLSSVCFSDLHLHRVLRNFIVLSEEHKDLDFFTVLDMALRDKKDNKVEGNRATSKPKGGGKKQRVKQITL